MSYQILDLRLLVRETGPARIPSALGKKGLASDQRVRVTSPLCHVHLVLRDSDGRETFGCSADRMSVRWLDKRTGRSKGQKLRELVQLIQYSRSVYVTEREFESPFQIWRTCHDVIMKAGEGSGQEELTATFVSSLFERALIDGVCRLEGFSFAEAVRTNRLGIDLAAVNPACQGEDVTDHFQRPPLTGISVRHTVGAFDPLTRDEIEEGIEIDDGLPVSLDECIDVYGLSCFKIKISGHVEHDLQRLHAVWEILPRDRPPIVTLDANEAYEDLEEFEKLVLRIEKENLALFQHIAFIEQPLPRRIAMTSSVLPFLRRIGERKPVIIDESDGRLGAFEEALARGYAGISHKNCKGIYKSLASHVRMGQRAKDGQVTIQSGEDLQNLPIVPLQQDLAVACFLRIPHVERNGHHYNHGLSMLSARERRSAGRHHEDLYMRFRGQHYLRIVDGSLSTGSLQGVGLGVVDEPDWNSMEPLAKWIQRRYPATT